MSTMSTTTSTTSTSTTTTSSTTTVPKTTETVSTTSGPTSTLTTSSNTATTTTTTTTTSMTTTTDPAAYADCGELDGLDNLQLRRPTVRCEEIVSQSVCTKSYVAMPGSNASRRCVWNQSSVCTISPLPCRLDGLDNLQ